MSAAEVKAEVEAHLKKKVAMEAVMPTSIMIGPFYVSTDGVRQGISKKIRNLANAVLDLLAKKLRMQAEEVSLLGCGVYPNFVIIWGGETALRTLEGPRAMCGCVKRQRWRSEELG